MGAKMRLRLGSVSPITPREWNRAITEGRMLSRNAGSMIVKPLGDQVNQSVAAKITAIKARARSAIFKTCKEAEQSISGLQSKKVRK
jgi:hypothetical protein